MVFDRVEYEKLLIDAGCVRIGENYKLSSGRNSPYHITFRNFGAKVYGELINFLEDFIKENIENHRAYQFIGVPYGATFIGADISERVGNGRKTQLRKNIHERADNPIARIFAGPMNPEPRDTILLIEDVLVTGSNSQEYINRVKRIRIKVPKLIVLCDRREKGDYEQPDEEEVEKWLKEKEKYKNTKKQVPIPEGRHMSAAESLEKKDIEILALTDIHTLIPRAIKEMYPEINSDNIKIIERVLEYYGEHGADRGGLNREVHVNEFEKDRFRHVKNIRPGDPLDTKLLQGFLEQGVLTMQ